MVPAGLSSISGAANGPGCSGYRAMITKRPSDTAFWDETEISVPAAVVIGGADRYGQQAAPADFVSFTARARSGDFGSEIEQQCYSLLRDAAIAYAVLVAVLFSPKRAPENSPVWR